MSKFKKGDRIFREHYPSYAHGSKVREEYKVINPNPQNKHIKVVNDLGYETTVLESSYELLNKKSK